MTLGFKCDFCAYFAQDKEEMRKHEINCEFNPVNRYCFTCKHKWDSGYDYSIPECEKNLSTLNGREFGSCKGWENGV